MKVTEKTEYLSLRDYLGRPAGSALGYAVATYATKLEEVIKLRDVPQYPKPINTYRLSFLKDAFNDKNLKALIEQDARLYEQKKSKVK